MDTHSPTIAVIDDEASVRKALVRLLRSAGFRAVEFSSASAFLRVFDQLSVDCLVVDLQMPELTGLDLQRYLRMVRPDSRLPVVIITAHDEPSWRERCEAAGAAAFFRKPVEGDALLEALAKLTAREQRARA